MKKFTKALDPITQNGLRVQSTGGFHKLEERIRSWNVGSFCGRGAKVCDLFRERKVGICWQQKVRWREQGARFVGFKGRGYKLWSPENNDGIRGVIILVAELSKKIVEVRSKSDIVMAKVLVFEEKIK